MKAHALVIAQTAVKHWASLTDTAVIAGKLAEGLQKGGFYTATNGCLSDGGDRVATEGFVAKWIRDLPEGSSAIILWAGHGYNNGVKHYLVCQDTPKDRIDNSNAIAAETLASFVGNSRAGSLLLIFDTCHSGKAASDLVKDLL